MQNKDIPPLTEIAAPANSLSFDQQRLQDYIAWKDSTTFMSLDSLPALLADPAIRLDPLLGYTYKVLCNNEMEIRAFLCRFTDLLVFEDCSVIEPLVRGEPWDESCEEDCPEYAKTYVQGRVLNIRPYFKEEEAVQLLQEEPLPVFDTNSFRINPKRLPDTFPAIVQWCGSDDWDRMGGIKTRMFQIISIPSAPGVITIL